MKHTILLFILTPLIFFSCKTAQKAVSELTEDDIVISISRGACFGECPMYTMNIYDGGYTLFEGKRFTDKLGLYSKQLSKSEYKDLITAFEDANFTSFDTTYKSMIPDLPLISISYKLEKGMKTVSGKESRPPSVRSLQYMLENIVKNENWSPVKPMTAAEIRSSEPPKETIIWNQIIIEPKSGKLPSFLNEMAEHTLRLDTRISKSQNLWLVTFNQKKIEPQKMMDMIKADTRIRSAEFNKIVELRESRSVEEVEDTDKN